MTRSLAPYRRKSGSKAGPTDSLSLFLLPLHWKGGRIIRPFPQSMDGLTTICFHSLLGIPIVQMRKQRLRPLSKVSQLVYDTAAIPMIHTTTIPFPHFHKYWKLEQALIIMNINQNHHIIHSTSVNWAPTIYQGSFWVLGQGQWWSETNVSAAIQLSFYQLCNEINEWDIVAHPMVISAVKKNKARKEERVWGEHEGTSFPLPLHRRDSRVPLHSTPLTEPSITISNSVTFCWRTL